MDTSRPLGNGIGAPDGAARTARTGWARIGSVVARLLCYPRTHEEAQPLLARRKGHTRQAQQRATAAQCAAQHHDPVDLTAYESAFGAVDSVLRTLAATLEGKPWKISHRTSRGSGCYSRASTRPTWTRPRSGATSATWPRPSTCGPTASP